MYLPPAVDDSCDPPRRVVTVAGEVPERPGAASCAAVSSVDERSSRRWPVVAAVNHTRIFNTRFAWDLSEPLHLRNLTLARVRYFTIFASGGVGGWCDPPAVSKRKVVELRGENERVCLDKHYTMVSKILTLGQHLT